MKIIANTLQNFNNYVYLSNNKKLHTLYNYGDNILYGYKFVTKRIGGFRTFESNPYEKYGKTLNFVPVQDGNLMFSESPQKALEGASFSTPIRTAKLALNDMMKGIL